MTNLILHLGAPKTGTTTIQHALYASRALLEDVGYYYPILQQDRPWESHHLLQALVKPHHKIQPYWRRGREPMALMQFTISAFKASLEKASSAARKTPTTIISSELLANHAYFEYFATWLKREFKDIIPIFYVRDEAAHYRAALQQHFKAGKFTNRPRFFDATLDRLQFSLDSEVRVMHYIESSVDPHWDLLSNFWSSGLGLPLSTLVRPETHFNTADPAEVTVILALATKHYQWLGSKQLEGHAHEKDWKLEMISWVRNQLRDVLKNHASATTKFELSAATNRRVKKIADMMSEAYIANPHIFKRQNDFDAVEDFQVFGSIDDMIGDIRWDKDVSMRLLDRVALEVRRQLEVSVDHYFFASIDAMLKEVALELGQL